MGRAIQLLVTFSVLLAITAIPAHAGVVTFLDRASFDTTTGGNLNFESFEVSLANGPAYVLPGFRVSETNGNNFLQRAGGVSATDGAFSVAYFDNGASLLEFQFDQPVNAFGFDLTTFADTSVTVGGDLSGSFSLSNQQPQFIGFVDNMGGTFQTLTFSVANSTQLRVDFDAVSFGTAAAVPEPSSFAMLLGLATTSVLSVRRRSRPSRR